jgi:hypothetical protein
MVAGTVVSGAAFGAGGALGLVIGVAVLLAVVCFVVIFYKLGASTTYDHVQIVVGGSYGYNSAALVAQHSEAYVRTLGNVEKNSLPRYHTWTMTAVRPVYQVADIQE